ncbi:unnamed protein product [Dibothriocephalus latus]|uniref:Uncharacterized protein n=1 Tax=Dibothriocephalus latus TaxID=60516 RepID=A0A3P7PYV2_DIBLA|nr:unnamed protein product [Dibothriocephalus latus]
MSTGPGLATSSSCLQPHPSVVDPTSNAASVGDERSCLTGALSQHTNVTTVSSPNSPVSIHNTDKGNFAIFLLFAASFSTYLQMNGVLDFTGDQSNYLHTTDLHSG